MGVIPAVHPTAATLSRLTQVQLNPARPRAGLNRLGLADKTTDNDTNDNDDNNDDNDSGDDTEPEPEV